MEKNKSGFMFVQREILKEICLDKISVKYDKVEICLVLFSRDCLLKFCFSCKASAKTRQLAKVQERRVDN